MRTLLRRLWCFIISSNHFSRPTARHGSAGPEAEPPVRDYF